MKTSRIACDPTSPPRANPRLRGGQPGNLNAFKHGFYSSFFKEHEIEAIQDLHDNDLREEIAALRVIIRRMLALSCKIEDVNTGLRLLSTLSAAAAQLSRLVKVQAVMQQGESEDSFEEALRQAILEWHEKKAHTTDPKGFQNP
jgi:uncharacterized protein YjcR